MAANEVRNGLGRQELEYLLVAKEAGDVDEQIVRKQVELIRAASEAFEIPAVSLASIAAISMRRAIRRCNVPSL